MSIYNYRANPTRAHKAVPSSGTRFSGAMWSYAGMDECQVAQHVLWRRTFSQWFHAFCVTSSPLCSLSGISSRTGEAGMTAPLSRKATAERKSWEVKGVKMKQVSWTNLPTSPKGLKAAFSICIFLVYHFTRILETTKTHTQQSVCRTVFFHLLRSSKFA